MKCLWLIFLLISFIWGQETQYERIGDPKDLSFPGGYIGISYEFDLKSKQKGFQIRKPFCFSYVYNTLTKEK